MSPAREQTRWQVFWRDRRIATRLGYARVTGALGPIAWVSLAAGVAYAVAGAMLGHAYPFFAAVAAFSALGFTPDVHPRRVGEVALGITLGVGMGELVQYHFSSGPIQIGVVVFVAAVIARFLDPSPVLTTQSVVQAIVVLGLPAVAATGGPVGRWTDALVGGAVALLFSVFIPKDPRKRPRTLARSTIAELGEVLTMLGASLRVPEEAEVLDALARARATGRQLATWEAADEAARSTVRLSPAWRRFLPELTRLTAACEFTDRAIRTTRVLARRQVVLAREAWHDDELAGLVEELAIATRRLGAHIGAGRDDAHVRGELTGIATRLRTSGERDPVRHTVLSLLRSLTFDLLRAAGADEREATEAFTRG